MNAVTETPADGPGAVLSRLAVLFELPGDLGHIARALAAHPRPSSLLALVDVGGQLGLKMTPIKSNAAGLATQNPPLIAHFDHEGVTGFGVVEKIGDDVEVWDNAHGRRVLRRDEFLARWSGVAVLVEPGERAAAAAGASLKRRLGALLAGGAEAPSVVSGPGAPALRMLLAIATIGLLILSIRSQPADMRVYSAALTFLSVLGLTVSGMMTVAISDYAGPFAPGICRRGRFVDCKSVLTSRFARFLGIPLSDLGVAFYAAILLLLAASGGRPAALAIVSFAFVASAPIALLLIAIQVLLRRLCTLCLAVHAINVTAAVIGWTHLADAPRLVDGEYTVLLFAFFLFVVLFLALPYMKQAKGSARLALAHGRVSGSPFGSLAQLLSEAPTDVRGDRCGIELGGSSAPDELIVFVHPSCKACEPVLREVVGLASGGRVHSFVAVPPMDPRERPLCEAIVAAGLAAGPEMTLRAYEIAKQRLDEVREGDPATILCSELSIAPDQMTASIAEARQLTSAAEVGAAAHVEGTPALFFNSLPYRGPVSHLLTLLNEHPELLPRPRIQEARR